MIYDLFSTGYLNSLTSSLVAQQLTTSGWTSHIYKSKLISPNEKTGMNGAERCTLLDQEEMTACDMVFMDGTHCHYGSYNNTDGNLVVKGTTWKVFIKIKKSELLG